MDEDGDGNSKGKRAQRRRRGERGGVRNKEGGSRNADAEMGGMDGGDNNEWQRGTVLLAMHALRWESFLAYFLKTGYQCRPFTLLQLQKLAAEKNQKTCTSTESWLVLILLHL